MKYFTFDSSYNKVTFLTKMGFNLLVTTLLIVLTNIGLNAQVFEATVSGTNFSICGQTQTLTITFTNDSGGPINNELITINMTNAANFSLSNFAQSPNVGAIFDPVANTITSPTQFIQDGEIWEFTFDVAANCGAENTQDPSILLSFESLQFTATPILIEGFSVLFGDLSIISTAIQGNLRPLNIYDAAIGVSDTLKVPVANAGQGSLDEFLYFVIDPPSVDLVNVVLAGNVLAPFATSGDTTFYLIDAALINGNTTGATDNGDALFDLNETLLMCEIWTGQDCSSTEPIQHGAQYGCFADPLAFCQRSNIATTGVSYDFALPELVPAVHTQLINRPPCYAVDAATMSYYIVNEGDVPAIDISIDAYAPGAGSIIPSSFTAYLQPDGSGTPFAGTVSTSTAASNACSSGGGVNVETATATFENVNLAAGDTLYVTFQTIHGCDCHGCTIEDVFWARLTAIGWTDGCDRTYVDNDDVYYLDAQSDARLLGFFEGESYVTTPSTCMDFTITQGFSHLFGYGYPNAYFESIITASPGVDITSVTNINSAGNPTATTSIDNQVSNPDGSEVVTAHSTANLGGSIQICFDIDCSENAGCPATASISMESFFITDPSCACVDNVSCPSSIQFVYDCPPCNPCDGLSIVDLDISRVNYGEIDANNDNIGEGSPANVTTPGVNPKVFLAGDTLKATLVGIVNDGSPLPTPHFWEYAFLEMNMNTSNFTILGGDFQVWDASTGNTLSCNVLSQFASPADPTLMVTDISAPTLDALTCSDFNGFEYADGDSLFLCVYYTPKEQLVNVQSTPYIYTPSWYLSDDVYDIGNRFSCNYLVETLNQIGVYYYEEVGMSGANFGGCETSPFYHQVRIHYGDLGYEEFPNEIRNPGNVDKYTFVKPPEFAYVPEEFGIRIREYMGTHTDIVLAPNGTLPQNFFSINGDTLCFFVQDYIDSLGPNIPLDEGTIFWFYPAIQGNCQSEIGTYNSCTKAVYDVDDNVFCQDEYVYDFECRNWNYTGGPELQVNSITPVIEMFQQSACAQVTITNTTNIPAPFTFLNVDDVFGGLVVTGVREDDGTGNFVPVSVNSFGIYELGLFPEGETILYEVCVNVTDCTDQQLEFSAGWDCQGYPTTVEEALCTEPSFVDFIAVSGDLDMTVIGPSEDVTVPLCDTVTYTLGFTSTQLGYLNQINFQYALPNGTTFIPGSFQIAYPVPVGTDTTFVTVTDPANPFGNFFTTELTQFDPILSTDGLIGSPGAATNENIVLVQFDIITDCNFASGSRPRFRSWAFDACGTRTRTIGLIGDRLFIDNAVPEYDINMNLGLLEMNACENDQETISIEMEIEANPGMSTSPGDSISIQLPQGINYVSGSYNPISNSSGSAPTPVTNNGQTTLLLPIQGGLVDGDMIQFELAIEATDVGQSCSQYEMIVQTYSKTNATCGTETCSISVLSGEKSVYINIVKPDLAIQTIDLNLVNIPPSNQLLEYTYTVCNDATEDYTGDLEIDLYADNDGNGLLDTNVDNIATSITDNVSIPGGTCITITNSALVSAGSLCQVLAVIDPNNNCTCDMDVSNQIEVTIENQFDTEVELCSGDILEVGPANVTGFDYEWLSYNGSNLTALSSTTTSPVDFQFSNTSGADIVWDYVIRTSYGNCYTYDTLTVTVFPENNVQVQVAACIGEAFVLPGSTTGSNFQWTPITDLDDPTISFPTLDPVPASGVYTLNYTDEEGCNASREVTINGIGCAPDTGIGDTVWYDLDANGVQDFGEPGIPGVTVYLYYSNNTTPGAHISATFTDANGYYDFTGIPSGTYVIGFVDPAGFVTTTANAGGDDDIDSDAGAGGLTGAYFLANNVFNPTVDAGYVPDCNLEMEVTEVGGCTEIGFIDHREYEITITWTNAVYTSAFLGGSDNIVVDINGTPYNFAITELSGDTTFVYNYNVTTGNSFSGTAFLQDDPACAASLNVTNVVDCVYDLALIKDIDAVNLPNPFTYGDPIPFIITVENQGSNPLTNIVVNDYLPSGYSFTPSINPGWTLAGPSLLQYTIGSTITPGNSLNIPLSLTLEQASGADEWLNYAEIQSMTDTLNIDRSNDDIDSTPDSNPSNDAGGASETASDDVLNGDGTGNPGDVDPLTDEDDHDPENLPIVDIALMKEIASPQSAYSYGDPITFNITVFNQGNVTLNNIVINDSIPSGYSWLASNQPTWSYAAPIASTTIVGPLAPNTSTTVQITLTIEQALLGNYTNIAEVGSFTNADGSVDLTNNDVDSVADTDFENDAGGNPDGNSDNVVDGDASGAPGSDSPSTDEDDSDPAIIERFAPVCQVSSDSPVCFGEDLQLQETGGEAQSWEWIGPNGFTSTLQNPLVVNPDAGTYGVIITDLNGFVSDTCFVDVIVSPEMLTQVDSTNVACNGEANGSIDLEVIGGIPPYTYDWDNDGLDDPDNDFQDLLGLTAGTYTVIITDAVGCFTTETVNITEPAALSCSTTPTDAACNGESTGSILVTATGGTTPYSYSLNGTTFQPGNNITNLAAGSYTVTVEDANGCRTTCSAIVNEPLALSCTVASTNASDCGIDDGTLDVTAAGGTGTIEYSIDGTNFQASNSFTGLSAGSYTVTVRDVNGCLSTCTADITAPDAPVCEIVSQTNVACFGDSTGEVTVSATGGSGTYEYSSDGVNFQALGTFTGLTEGTYNITVRNVGNPSCTSVCSVLITENDQLECQVAGTNLVCNGDNSGMITVASIGGSGEFEYSIDGANFQISNTFTGLAANSYTVTTRDENFPQCTVTCTIDLTEPAVLSCSTIPTDALCNGEASGTIAVMPTGGTGPYQYSLEGSAFQPGALFENLVAGTYTVDIMDANGCMSSCGATIAEPPALSCTVASTDASDCGVDDGTLDVTAAGGTGTIEYSIDGINFQASNSFTGLSAGSYTVTVRDANGCTSTCTADIAAPNAPMCEIISQTNVACFGNSTGEVTVSATDGSGIYEYSIDGTNFQTSGTFSGLVAGTYNITVRNVGNPSCTSICSTVITENPELECQLTGTDLTCNGDNSGSVSVSAIGGTGSFEYSIDGVNFQISDSFTGLAAGSHTITTRDSNNPQCTTTCTIILTEPVALSCSLTPTDALCNGEASGTITVTPSDGTAPYEYSLNGSAFQPGALFENLVAGAYTVEIMDANGCLSTCSTNIAEPPALSCTVNANDASDCGIDDGALEVTATGGTGIIDYSIDGIIFQSGSTFIGLSAGSYTVTVMDANGCISTCTAEIFAPNAPVCEIVSQTDVACFGESTGEVTITATGGSGNYEYSIDGTNFQPSGTFAGLAAGTYNLTVRNVGNPSCTSVCSVLITENDELECQVAGTNLACNGDNSGTITVASLGGSGEFEYSIDGVNFQISSTFTGLAAGSYTVTTRDENFPQCTVDCTIDLTEPAALSCDLTPTDALCNGEASGTITVTPNGGTAPFEYSLEGSPFQPGNLFENLLVGTYIVEIMDANGCTNTCNVEVNEPPALSCVVTPTDASDCGIDDGTLDVTATGGTGTIEYSIDGTNFQAASTFTGLSAGNYTVTIRDANGCLSTCTADIFAPNAPVCEIVSQTNVACFGESTGEVIITATGGSGTFEYSIDGTNFQPSGTFAGLAAGTYNLTVRNVGNPNCTSVCSVLITENDELECQVAGTNLACNGDNSGTITVTSIGGSGEFEYSIDGVNFQISSTFTGLAAGSYTVTTRDENFPQCTVDCTIDLTEPAALSCSLVATDVLCNGGSSGTITVTPSGGTAPFVYSANGSPFQPGSLFENLVAGAYLIEVMDANNCITTCFTNVNEPPALTCDAAGTDASDCNVDDGSILVVAAGGTGAVEYSIDGVNFQVDNSFTGLGVGVYTVTVRDANGCTSLCEATIGAPEAPICEVVSTTNIACFGESTGVIEVQGTGGSGNYEYSIDGTNFQAVGIFTGLPAGNYSLTVRNVGNPNCTSVCNVVLTEQDILECQIIGTDLTCNSDNSGELFVTAVGGSGDFEYSIDGVNFQLSNVFNGLAAGTHTVTTRDENYPQCTVQCQFTLAEPEVLTCALDSTDALCNGSADGTITVNASGGTGPYNYSLEGGAYQPGNFFSGLTAGTYNVTVEDDNGCLTTCSIVVNEPPVLSCTNVATDATDCETNDGTITVTAAGGTPNYMYSLNGGVDQASNFFDGLAPGSYIITVTDDNGCQSTCEATILAPEVPMCEITSTVNVSCFGLADGELTVIGTGGTGSYEFSIDGVNFQTSGTFTGLAAGIHTVTVTNAGDLFCLSTCSVEITEPELLTCSLEATPETCLLADGTITVLPMGGTMPYNYSLNGAVAVTDSIFTGLIPGSYTVDITDANGCTTQCSIDVAPDCFDLAITKVVSPTQQMPIYAGDTVTYQVQVFNQGTLPAYNVEIVDYIPTDLILADSDWLLGLGGLKAFYFEPGPIAPGTSTIIDVDFIVDTGFGPGTINNTAEIVAADNDNNPNNNPPTDFDSTPDDNPTNDGPVTDNEIDNNNGDEDDADPAQIQVQVFDLALTKDLNASVPLPLSSGDTLTFDITVTNQGSVDAYNVEVTDYLPSYLQFESTLNNTMWSADPAGAVFNQISYLAVGGDTIVQITVILDPNFQGTLIENTAEISSADDDTDPSNDPPNDVDSTPDDTDDDPEEEDDHDGVEYPVEQSFDLALIKQVSPTQATPIEIGDTVEYIITVSNQGTLDAYNVEVVDYVPTGLTVIDNDWSVGADPAEYFITHAGPLVPGASVQIPLTTMVNANAAGGSLMNFAEINKADDDTDPFNQPPVDEDSTPDSDNTNDGNYTDDDTDNTDGDEDDHDPAEVFIQVFDLALDKSISSSTTLPIMPGSTVTFDITVTNQGNVDAYNIQVTDYLQPYFTLNDANWAPSPAGAVFNEVSYLPVGMDTVIQITVDLDLAFQGDVVENTAEISAHDDDDDPTNEPPTDIDSTPDDTDDDPEEEDDHDSEEYPIGQVFDLALIKSLAPGQATSVAVGDTVSYQIEVFNQGTLDAYNIQVVDYLPQGMTNIDPNWAQGGFATNEVFTTIPGPLAPTTSTIITIDVVINEMPASGQFVNLAEISGAQDDEGNPQDDYDSTPDNNPNNDGPSMDDDINNTNGDEDDSDPAVIGVDFYDLALTKTVQSPADGMVSIGDVVIYEFQVFNQGSAPVSNVVITDYIPNGLLLVDPLWTSVSATEANHTIGVTIQPNSSAIVQVSFLVTPSAQPGDITNFGEISSFTDVNGNPQNDVDSTPDNNPNNDGNYTDNVINEDGVNGNDQDDHDPATIQYNYFDLALDKKLAGGQSAPFQPGQNVTFTFTVYNQGTIDATNVTISDYIQPGFILNDADWLQSGSTATYTFSGVIPAGTQATVNVTMQIDPNYAGGILDNYGEISNATGPNGETVTDIDSTPDNDNTNDGNVTDDAVNNENGDQDDHDIASIPVDVFDLALTKSLSPGEVGPYTSGSIVSYDFEIFNQGSIPATNVQVVDYVPVGLQYVTGSQTWSASSNGNLYTTVAGPIAPNTSVIITVQFMITDDATSGSLTNYAEIVSAQDGNGNPQDDIDSTPDDNNGNDGPVTDGSVDGTNGDEDDHDPETIDIQMFDLALVKTLADGQPSVVAQGDLVTYNISVINQGSVDAYNIVVNDFIPAGFTLADADWNDLGGSVAQYVVSGPIFPNGDFDIEITLQVESATAEGDYTNYAEIQSATDENGNTQTDIDSTPDNDPTNDGPSVNDETDGTNGDEDDHDPEVITVSPAPIFDLALTKMLAQGQASTVSPGDAVTYTLTIYNQGNVAASNVQIIDTYPAGLTLTDGSWADIGGNQAAYTYLGTIQPGANAQVNITFEVNTNITGTSLTNYGEIAGATDDQGNPQTDIDSTPDDISNNDGVPTDNVIDGTDGDEDDHDPETVNVAFNDLALTKSLAFGQSDVVTVGSSISFAITVTNQGNAPAYNVEVVDYIPDGLSLNDATWQLGFTGNAYNVIPGPINPGESANLLITLAVGSQATVGDNMNFAEIVGFTDEDNNPLTDYDSAPDDNPTNDGGFTDDAVDNENGDEDDHDPAIFTVAEFDLALTKSLPLGAPTVYNVGDMVDFVIQVYNQGDIAATNIMVTDYLPTGLVDMDADWTVVDATMSEIMITDVVMPGDVYQLTFTTQITPDAVNGNLVNFAEISQATDVNGVVQEDSDSYADAQGGNDFFDQVLGDNNINSINGDEDDHDPAVITIGSDYVDVELTKTTDATVVEAGDVFTYTLTVTNIGTTTATNVTVLDQMPTGLIYQSSNGNYNPFTSIWTVGTLGVNEVETIDITVQVVSINGPITNIAEVETHDQEDIDSTPGDNNNDPEVDDYDDEDSVTVYPVDDPQEYIDLELGKTVDATTIAVNDVITYTLTVTNQGPDVATGVFVQDQLPAALSFISSNGTYNSLTGIWQVGTIGVGQSASIQITAIVIDASGPINNIAEVIAHNEVDIDSTPGDNNGDEDTDDYDDEDSVTVYPEDDGQEYIDLDLSKTVNATTVSNGDVITYTLSVSNQGPDVATGVTVHDQLPAGLTFLSSNGNYNAATGIWNVGTIGVNESASVQITVIVSDASAPINNIAEVATHDQIDIDSTPGDNNGDDDTEDYDDEDSVTIYPEDDGQEYIDLDLSKTVDATTVSNGDLVTYLLTVTNQGPDVATGVTVHDQLPAGLTFISSNGNYNAATGIWNIGTIAVGQAVSIQITVIVSDASAPINNIAEVATHDQIDIDSTPGDNNGDDDTDDYDDEDSVTIYPEDDGQEYIDLDLSKTVDATTVSNGDLVTYLLTVTNQGPDVATGVTVHDQLPVGLTFLSSNGDYNAATGIWNVGTIGVNESVSVQITVIVSDASAPINNIAEVATHNQIDIDSTPGDNNGDDDTDDYDDEDSVTIYPEDDTQDYIDLELSKTVDATIVSANDIVTYTLSLTNDGPSIATGVVVQDQLPGGLTYVSSTGSYNPVTGEWAVGTVGVNQTVSIQISASVANINLPILNIAEVIAHNEIDIDSTPDDNNNNTNVDDFDDEDSAMIYPMSSDCDNPIECDAMSVCTEPMTPIIICPDYCIPGTEFSNAESLYHCSINELPNGCVEYMPLPGMEMLGTDEVVIFGTAPDGSCVAVPVSVGIGNCTASIDLELTKTVTPNIPLVGDPVFYTLTLENNGPDAAENIVVSDVLPTGVSFLSASGGAYNSATGHWTISTLGANQQTSLTITALVTGESSQVTNTAQVIAADGEDADSTPNNNDPSEDDQDSATFIIQIEECENEALEFCTGHMEAIDICPEFCEGDDFVIDNVVSLYSCSVWMYADGCFRYTPLPGYYGTDYLSVTATNANGETAEIDIYITVSNDCDGTANEVPEANDDNASTMSGVATTINVLPNDTDADGDALEICNFTQPSNGTVQLINGQFVYTSNMDYVGNDSFTYTVCDGNGGESTATVNLTVEPYQCTNADVEYCTQPMTEILICPEFCDFDENYTIYTDYQITNVESLYGCSINMVSDDCITYIPLPGFVGVDNIIIHAVNDAGVVSTVSVFVTTDADCSSGKQNIDATHGCTLESIDLLNPQSLGVVDVVKGIDAFCFDNHTYMLNVYSVTGQLVYTYNGYVESAISMPLVGEEISNGTYIYYLTVTGDDEMQQTTGKIVISR